MRFFGIVCFFLMVSFLTLEASIKAIIFDCDGVLVDTEELKFQAWAKVLEESGITLSLERYQSLIGQTGLSILKSISQDHQIEFDPNIVDKKNELYWELQKTSLKSIEPMINVVEWARIKRDNHEILLGVASSSSRKEILCNLEFLKISDQFDVILSGKDDLKSYHNPLGVNKPQPYIYLEMCHLLGLNPNECLVIEDSEAGVISAKTAGCLVIAVPTQWTQQQNFGMADLILYDCNSEQIIKNIQNIKNFYN